MAKVDTTKITIDDVAKLAGVSTMTVSRYLNETGPVSKATATKVQFSGPEIALTL